MRNPFDASAGTRAAARASGLTIRLATPADADAVRRVATLDERPLPHGELVVAEVGGEIVAALPVAGGPPVADPFRPTAELLPLLELRARQLCTASPGRRLARVWAPRLAR